MIKNLLFDFGDIFINLDKEAPYKKMGALGMKSVSPEMELINKQYEKGLVTTKDFVTFYQDIFTRANKKQLVEAWNSIILDFPEYRLTFIEELAKNCNYRLLLLSNTNQLHIEQVVKNMGEERYIRFRNCFEVFYLSHEINLRKPDADIYHFVLEQNNLVASETLFIDDTLENTEAAQKLGIHTWNLIPKKDDVTNLFKLRFFNE
jgi:putative hydrolase of the HAD superfamily